MSDRLTIPVIDEHQDVTVQGPLNYTQKTLVKRRIGRYLKPIILQPESFSKAYDRQGC